MHRVEQAQLPLPVERDVGCEHDICAFNWKHAPQLGGVRLDGPERVRFGDGEQRIVVAERRLRARGDDAVDERGAESHARLEPVAKAVVVLPCHFVNHDRQAWAVIWHQLGRDDEHGRRIGCARVPGVEHVRQPTRERCVDPEASLRDVADDHLNRRVRRDVAHDIPLTVRSEGPRDRADDGRPLERRAAGQTALDQRE